MWLLIGKYRSDSLGWLTDRFWEASASVRTSLFGRLLPGSFPSRYPPVRFEVIARGNEHRNGPTWWLADVPAQEEVCLLLGSMRVRIDRVC